MTNLTEFGKLLCVDPVLRPLSLVAAVDVDGNRVLVGAHHALDIVLFEGAGKLAVRVRAVLEAMFLALSGHGFVGDVTNINIDEKTLSISDTSLTFRTHEPDPANV